MLQCGQDAYLAADRFIGASMPLLGQEWDDANVANATRIHQSGKR